MSNPSDNQAKKAWVVTFYAFKGGTGRTLALSNVARYLAEDQGCRVGIIDLDLDAPGLPRQALCRVMQHDEDSPTEYNRDDFLQEIDRSYGFIDLFTEAYSNGLKARTTSPNIAENQFCLPPASLSRAVVPIPSNKTTGSLLLMPAGKGSATFTNDYRQKLGDFSSMSAAAASDQSASRITSAILGQFIEEYSLDFVLLDGRTGMGAFFPVYALAVPHALVLFVGLNDQNIAGSLQMLDHTTVGSSEPAPVFLVASPAPTSDAKFLESRIDALEKQLKIKLEDRRLSDKQYVYQCPEQVEFQLPYVTMASCQETYFIQDYPRSPLSAEYIRLAQALEGLVEASPTPQGAHTNITTPPTVAAPLRIALEEVHFEAMHQFLEETLNYKRRVGDRNKKTQRYYGANSDQEVVEVTYSSATDMSSPWERLSTSEQPKVPETLPSQDILIVPQSLLPSVVKGLGSKVSDLGALTVDGAYSELLSQLDVLNPRYLDTTYHGWRDWCVCNGGHYALPFSANSPILCANEDHLKDSLCIDYWRSTGNAVHPTAFLPSSWHLLKRVLETANGTLTRPFEFADEGRGLYYEWLNFLLSYGCIDFEHEEWRHRSHSGIKEAIPATQLFLQLLRTINRKSNERPSKPQSMSDLIFDFAAGNLSMYIGWNDSFRFTWSENGEFPSKVAPVQLPTKKVNSKVRLRFGAVPREVTHHRRPLLANWVALVTAEDPPRVAKALHLLNTFLDESVQLDLLKRGFPSPSLRVVDAEIWSESLRERQSEHAGRRDHAERPGHLSETDAEKERILSNAETERILSNYRVFLRSLRESMSQGHRIAAAQRSPEIVDSICRTLTKLLGSKTSNETETDALIALHDEVVSLLRQTDRSN